MSVTEIPAEWQAIRDARAAELAALNAGRWVYQGYYGGRQYNWAQCRYCGRGGADCQPVACMLCASVQCQGNGTECHVCHFGWLPGWSRGYLQEHKLCGYAHCDAPAVATLRKRRACMAHAMRVKVSGQLLAEYVAERLAHRDSGKGWERFRFVAGL